LGLNLTYYIFEGVLVGAGLHMSVGSGGGSGSTRRAPTPTANNPYATAVRTRGHGKGHVHGGPIPAGIYQIETPAKHGHLGLSAALLPRGPLPGGRGGFYIHGRGPHGSDGCLVPVKNDDFKTLMELLRKSEGGTLVVRDMTGDTAFA
jgi:hypothetical protein